MVMGSEYEAQAEAAGLRSDLDALDAVRDELRNRVPEVHLPGIVVVGNQSSGKSSVLESISRVPLPRGQGTVTRCPVKLVVRQSEEFTAEVQKGSELTNPDAVSKAIETAMKRLVPTGGFSREEVTVRINQPLGPDLTLIDLPGLIALDDDPNKGLIDSLVGHYLKPPGAADDNLPVRHGDDTLFQAAEHTEATSASPELGSTHNVIVCVLDANSDWVTAAAISRAKEHDPFGERTLFVITKIDRREPGFRKSLDTLEREHLRAQSGLGYVMVRNRTQEEIAQKMSAEDALQKEKDFFDGHNLTAEQLKVSKELRSLSPDKKGTVQLIKKLVQAQQKQVRKRMPGLRKEIDDLIKGDTAELNHLAIYAEHEPAAQRELHSRLTEATRRFHALYIGQYGSEDDERKVEKQLQQRMHALPSSMWSAIGGTDGEYVFAQASFAQKVKNALEDEAERFPFLHNNGPVMTHLYTREVYAKILAPCQQLINDVRVYLGDVWRSIFRDVLEKLFPRLAEAVLEQVEKHLDDRRDAAQAFVNSLVNHAKGIYTRNSRYADAASSTWEDISRHRDLVKSQGGEAGASSGDIISPPVDPLQHWWRLKQMEQDEPALWELARKRAWGLNLSEQEMRVNKIQFLLAKYARVVVDRVIDEVPLAIYAILVEQVVGQGSPTSEATLTEVVSRHFFEAQTVLDLMYNPAHQQKRRVLEDRLAALTAARRRLPM